MSQRIGKNNTDNRRVNRGSVLYMIATGQCFTRSDLVRETGLSKMAISNIVSQMMDHDILRESHILRNDVPGRNPVGLALSPNAPRVVGLSILRDRCACVLCDLDLTVRKRAQATFQDMTREKLVQTIYQLLDTVLEGESHVIAIGISSIGPINAATGTILKPLYFFGIENFKITSLVEERYHLPVYFDHDNQSALLAESLFGHAKGYHDVLYIGVSDGVGSGIITNGQLYSNRRGLPPEIGHVSVDIYGTPCQCGNRGCVEAYLRTPVLLHLLREKTHTQLSYPAYCAMKQDSVVDDIFTQAVHKLAAATVNAVNILNSELVLLGNDCTYWPERYVTQMEQEINSLRFAGWNQRIVVKKSFFLQDAPIFGAACNAIAPIFSGELVHIPT